MMAARDGDRPAFLAQSRAMRPVLRLIERSGPCHANVLITGEAGTGKSVVARALHAASPRSDRPLFSIIGGGRPDDALEVELFGASSVLLGEGVIDRAGIYELADQGTLLIDEAANLPTSLQARLLAALESGTCFRNGSGQARRANVRILAATSATLAGEAALRTFNRELLMRLSTIEIELPPLRERPEDIPLLAQSCLREFAELHGSLVRDFDDSAMAALVRHRWPGNVRELRHAIECAVRVARRPVLTVRDLGLRVWGERSPRLDDLTLFEAEEVLIRRALARSNGDWRWAAAALGLTPFDFRQRVRRHNL
jgi:DNA-binding NtrC family response regulator